MSGMKNVHAAEQAERLRDWGDRADDGTIDLSSAKVLSAEASITQAQLNAGATVLVPAVPGRKYRPVGFLVRVSGAFTGLTDVRISSTDNSKDYVTIARAQLTNGAVHAPGAGTHTLVSDFGTDSGVAGAGVHVRKTGGNATGGTSITVVLFYRIIA